MQICVCYLQVATGKLKDALLVARKATDAAERLLGQDHRVSVQLALRLWSVLTAAAQVGGMKEGPTHVCPYTAVEIRHRWVERQRRDIYGASRPHRYPWPLTAPQKHA